MASIFQTVMKSRRVMGEVVSWSQSRTFTTGTVLNASPQSEIYCPVLTINNMNPCIKAIQYAVRGPLVIRAAQIEKELDNGQRKPFDEVLWANIGNPHAMGQCPLTFIRQVLALVTYPPLLTQDCFPKDAKQRARDILDGCMGGSVGSYTDSVGLEIVRKHCAEYIKRRDEGVESNWEDVTLSTGASESIKTVLQMFNGKVVGKKPGVMVQIPQYPLYSATLSEFDMHLIGFYLDESKNWGLDIGELKRAYDESVVECHPRVLVVINPGNPTGQVLSRENIKEIVEFAHKNRLFLLADEVYQDNVYGEGSKFHSFKKVMYEMGPPYCKMELASFMSVSKGYMGECGARAGYVELINVLPEVRAMYLKSITARLCSSVLGQVVMDCVVAPPKPGDASHERFEREKEAVLRSLAERAKIVTEAFNSFPGMSCNTVQGAMYAFPRLKLPDKAVAKAKEMGLEPDAMYAFELLESTGICVIPGSGFGQTPGTHHFRMTILHQPKKLKELLEKFQNFQNTFLQKYK